MAKHKHEATCVSGAIKDGKRIENSPWMDKIEAIVFWCRKCKKEYIEKR